MPKELRWTIAALQGYELDGDSQEHRTFFRIDFERVPISEYRTSLIPLGSPGHLREKAKYERWQEVLCSTRISLVEEGGLKAVLDICEDNETFRYEMQDLLEAVWRMGRAYERHELASRRKKERKVSA